MAPKQVETDPRHPNPRKPTQAVLAALNESHDPSRDWRGWCLRFVAQAYGWQASGEESAWAWWEALPEEWCHYNDKPDVGAVVIWKGGRRGFGHAAIHCGAGQVLTAGFLGVEAPRLVRATSIGRAWDMSGGRWGSPVFPRAVK